MKWYVYMQIKCWLCLIAMIRPCGGDPGLAGLLWAHMDSRWRAGIFKLTLKHQRALLKLSKDWDHIPAFTFLHMLLSTFSASLNIVSKLEVMQPSFFCYFDPSNVRVNRDRKQVSLHCEILIYDALADGSEDWRSSLCFRLKSISFIQISLFYLWLPEQVGFLHVNYFDCCFPSWPHTRWLRALRGSFVCCWAFFHQDENRWSSDRVVCSSVHRSETENKLETGVGLQEWRQV